MLVNTNTPPPPPTHTHTHTHTHTKPSLLIIDLYLHKITRVLWLVYFIMQRLRRLWRISPPHPLPRHRQVVLGLERLWESADLKRPPFCKVDQLVTYSECAHNTYKLKWSRSRDLWWTVWQCNRFSDRVFALPPSLKLRWFSALVTIWYCGIWSEPAFEGGKWSDRSRPHSWGGPALQA